MAGKKIKKAKGRLGFFLILAVSIPFLISQNTNSLYPGNHWLKYENPEAAGWSGKKLEQAKKLWEECGSDAFMVIDDGVVVVAWGDVTRRYMCHSVRKSFLSALYGVFVGEGRIDTSATIEDIGIDDKPPLTELEKSARVADLLKSRSGVYHPAAYETPSMKKRRPARGSKKPGSFWYYNNWDFNALGTIFRKATGTDLFEAFKQKIADPIGMDDFRLMDCYYHLEARHSIHPAYPFRMSARDMARFGLLYLRNGVWQGKRIVPAEWVKRSITPYSDVSHRKGWGYGFLWWIIKDRENRKCGMYMALGYGGHVIAVLPREKLVIVNRPNTYIGDTTPMDKFLELVDALLDAKSSNSGGKGTGNRRGIGGIGGTEGTERTVGWENTGDIEEVEGTASTGGDVSKAEPAGRARLIPLEARPKNYNSMINHSVPLEPYIAEFNLKDEETFRESVPYVIGDIIGNRVSFERHGEKLLMRDSLGQRYFVVPLARDKFLIEDMEVPILFELDESGKPVRLTIDARPGWLVSGERTG